MLAIDDQEVGYGSQATVISAMSDLQSKQISMNPKALEMVRDLMKIESQESRTPEEMRADVQSALDRYQWTNPSIHFLLGTEDDLQKAMRGRYTHLDLEDCVQDAEPYGKDDDSTRELCMDFDSMEVVAELSEEMKDEMEVDPKDTPQDMMDWY